MTTSPKTTINIIDLTDQVLAVLDARSRDVISRRYGIKNGQSETLEGIGKDYGITRERVRQIQSQAKRALVDLADLMGPVTELYAEVFKQHGGILSEAEATRLIAERFEQELPHTAYVTFYLDILPPYRYVTRSDHFDPHWLHPELVAPEAETVVAGAQTILRRKKHPLDQATLFAAIRVELAASEQRLPDEYLYARLMASKPVKRSAFGEWGLSDWAETSPRGVGDKAYAILRRHGKPEHFTAICEMINEAAFDHKQANPQTVHNELIKDERFVLVGRGLYGLVDWGFISGTVADVIESLLAKADKPLSREEVIKQVLAQRQVKKNTILLGLQNPKRFVRTEGDSYTLRS